MSQPSSASSSSLDDELGIPQEATLAAPPTLHNPIRLQLLLTPPDIPSNFVTVASSPGSQSHVDDNDDRDNDDDRGSSQPAAACPLSIRVSSEWSIRGDSARCIVVGRQASAADIRIDHKSVSRRHTALYYITNTGSGDAKDGGAVFVVQDLGGKHGTYVGDTRLEKNGRMELSLGGRREHAVRIGNAPLICRAMIVPSAMLNEQGQTMPQQQQEVEVGGDENDRNEVQKSPALTASTQSEREDATKRMDTEDATAAPSTRQSREEQIAAMVASLDSNPVYKKFMPQEENDVTEGMSNLATDNNNNNNNNNNNKNLHNNPTSNNKGYSLPITSSITLAPDSSSFASSDGSGAPLKSSAAVSALVFEPSGARLVAGHRDGTLRFYDFHGMRPTQDSQTMFAPFRVVDSDNDPLDQTGRHVITALGASGTGGRWIVGTTSAQPRILDREGGTTMYHFIKGDAYVTDCSKTKGHTAGVTGVAFHPLIKETCWTAGLDGSVRQWDIGGRGKLQFGKLVCQKVVAKCKDEKGRRSQVVSNVSVHPGGRKLVVGTLCGSIQVWSCFGSGVNSRPLGAVFSAHGENSRPVTFVSFDGKGERIASRSEADDTVRIWSVDRIEKGTVGNKFGKGGRGKEGERHPPSLLLAVCTGLPALNESATCAFGPDGSSLCAGTSVDPRAIKSGKKASGMVKFYRLPELEKRLSVDKKSSNGDVKGGKKSKEKRSTAFLDPVAELDVAPDASVLGVQWHPVLNQIALGTSDGIIRVLYDPVLSTKGALLPTSRAVRRSDGLSDLLRSRAPTGSAAFISSANSAIINPNALPLFREEPRATRKTKEAERKDAEKTKMPEPPVTGGMKTGTSGMGGGLTFSQYIRETVNYGGNKNIAGKDPREELFKYSEGKKSYVAKAYEGDVQRILAEKTVEEEEADLKMAGRKRQKTK